MAEVAATPTPLSRADGLAVLAAAHYAETGAIPASRAMLEHVWGIIGVENAHGRAIMNHNWGNIMAGPGWTGDKWPHPKPSSGQPTHFRSYPNHLTGARAFWRELYKRRGVLRHAIAGNPRGMVRELYETRYVVGGNREGYAHGIRDTARGARESGEAAGWAGQRSALFGFGALGTGLLGLAGAHFGGWLR